MTVERYTKTMLGVLALAASAIAVHLWVDPGPLGRAEAQAPAKYQVAVPKAWGKLVGFSNNNLLLEAPDGTLRIVDVEGPSPEYPKVKVQMRWQ